jgi:hypothetical protein
MNDGRFRAVVLLSMPAILGTAFFLTNLIVLEIFAMPICLFLVFATQLA